MDRGPYGHGPDIYRRPVARDYDDCFWTTRAELLERGVLCPHVSRLGAECVNYAACTRAPVTSGNESDNGQRWCEGGTAATGLLEVQQPPAPGDSCGKPNQAGGWAGKRERAPHAGCLQDPGDEHWNELTLREEA